MQAKSVYDLIKEERDRQLALWSFEQGLIEWLLLIENQRRWMERGGLTGDEARQCLVRIAALAVLAIESQERTMVEAEADERQTN